MISGLASDRNRRPPTAALLADALDTLASQMQAAAVAGTRSEVTEPRSDRPADATVITQPSPMTAPPRTAPRPAPRPMPRPTPTSAATPTPPPPAGPYASGTPFPSPTPTPSSWPPGPSISQPEPVQSFVGGGSASPTTQPTGTAPAVAPRQDSDPARRPTSYYVLLGVAALALFALSMFVTILILT